VFWALKNCAFHTSLYLNEDALFFLAFFFMPFIDFLSLFSYYSQETGEVTRKVYVGGIPYYSTEDDIRSYFESCGTIIDIDCMKFPESGKFRGIAIISFKVGSSID